MDEFLEAKRKVELPRALRQIVKVLADEGPLTYDELAEKLEKDDTTIIRQCQKLAEMEIVVKLEKGGRAAVALADGVTVDEEGNVYMPSPFSDPVEELKSLLEEAGVKGRKLRWIMRLVESNNNALQDPNVLYDTLTGAGVRRQLAQQIVKAFFGSNWQPPVNQPTPMPGVTPRNYSQFLYGGYPIPPMHLSGERELLRLEMKFEKLLEELRREREKASAPTYPVVRRIKTDESGKPVEIVEEPVVPGMSRGEDMTKILMYIMSESNKQHNELMKYLMAIQESMRTTVEKLVESQKDIMREIRDAMIEQEKKRLEEMSKLREEMVRKDAEWEKRLLEEKMRELEETISSVKSYYEQQTKKIIEELRKEWEWKERLRELEEKRSLRDVVVEELRSAGKELMNAAKEMRTMMKDYMEQQLKQNIAQKQVPEVETEEKKRILEALRRATGKKPSTYTNTAPSSEEEEGDGSGVRLRIVSSSHEEEEEGCPLCSKSQ